MKPIPIIIAVVIFVVSGAIIIDTNLEVTSLGYELGKEERETRALEEAARNLRSEVSRQVNHREIARLVEEHELALTPPGDGDAKANAAKG